VAPPVLEVLTSGVVDLSFANGQTAEPRDCRVPFPAVDRVDRRAAGAADEQARSGHAPDDRIARAVEA
jgi:hypothetical protein